MPHMVAQEHMGFVDALRYGTARTDATMAAAISGIGATPAILVLTFAGDGAWTLTSNLTTPSNITVWIPPGVTVNRATGVTLTIQGQLISWNPTWETGPGLTNRVFSEGSFTEFTRLSPYLGISIPYQGTCMVAGVQGSTQILTITQDTVLGGLDNSIIRFIQPPGTPTADIWDVGMNSSLHQWYVGHPGQFGRLVLNNTGLALNNTSAMNPSHLLHLQADDAFKATSAWSVPSDARLKRVLGDFTDGLSTLCALPQSVRFQWNGKGGTLDDGTVFYGRIAQDVQPVAPYLIREYEDKLQAEDAEMTTLLSANDAPLIEILINAVKELSAQVTALTARVTTLEGVTP